MSNNNNNTTIEKLISACTGAIITSVMVTPMDVIKMRLQTQERPSFSKRTCCTWNQCSLTQSTKSYKITPVQGKGLQLANIHECALSQQRTVPRGTIVRNIVLLFSVANFYFCVGWCLQNTEV